LALLRLSDVGQTYWRGGRPHDVLRDVSLELDAGDFVAVYGARNAGKSTLLKVAAGFEAPDTGTVTFEGRDLSTLSRQQRARLHHEEIAWVERSGPHSGDLPIALHVALPLYDVVGRLEAQDRAFVALAKVGASDAAYMRWADLWDEARIRVAIAQALVREPKVLVLDDPTRGLGIVEREAVAGLLRSAAEEGGLGVLMAVPDMPAMLPATQVRMLTRGRLLAPAPDSNIVEIARYRRA
jgi:ABC-type lipoprotein export system ATPase subunit